MEGCQQGENPGNGVLTQGTERRPGGQTTVGEGTVVGDGLSG